MEKNVVNICVTGKMHSPKQIKHTVLAHIHICAVFTEYYK